MSLKSFFVCFILASLTSPLAAEIQITDSHGKYNFAEPPKRVVALNWTLAENMLELGETPIGMANIKGFRKHASQPSVPESVIDVGERLNPKLKTIRELKPDVILIGYSQRSLLRPLSNIATVVYFKNFGKRYNNYEKSRERFLEMAKLFDKTEFAENKLAEADKRFAQLREDLGKAFPNDELPALQIVIPQSEADAEKNKSLWLFGKNSLPFYAAEKLGLQVISPEETSQFGTAQIARDELQAIPSKRSREICRVNLSSYWNNSINEKQVVTQGCSFEPSYQNAFGGVISVLYLSEAIHQGLLEHSK